MPREYPTVLDLVGGTPLVQLQRLTRGLPARVVAKLEYLNPGGSVKDRIGLPMIEAAERDGRLRPGGTIVEPTSGNTGVGLAIAAAIKGYRCVFVMPDKMSQEKISLLRAYGAEVVICPTAVEPESPESYYSVSDRLAAELPGGFKPDQYSNMANPEAHYETTGPEIWEQTGGELDAMVIALGTGGTVSGRGPLPEGAEPRPADRGRRPRGLDLLPARGRAPLPGGGDRRGLLPGHHDARPDRRVRDRVRPRLLPDRPPDGPRGGPLVGGSGGTAVHAALQVAARLPTDATVVTLIPDSGRSYLSKFYDDNYMLEHGFLERTAPTPTVGEVLRHARGEHADLPGLVAIESHHRVGEAIALMQRYSISQLPVVRRQPARVVRRRGRLAARAQPAGPGVQEPGRGRGGRAGGDAAAARQRRRATSRWIACSPICPAAARRWWWPAAVGRPGC